MATDHIRYDILAQDALRGMIRRVLEDAARAGLPGEHHFFISFLTRAPGVRLSARMRERYPDEMTIVLQHQFWDLDVTEQGFEVGLSFNGIPERLFVPFDALSGFHDPSVEFGLKFQPLEEPAAASNEDLPAPTHEPDAPAADTAPMPPPAPAGDESEPPPSGGAEVVSLDRFRKK